MPSRNIADLDPRLQTLAQDFLDRCKLAGVDVIITQTYRSAAEQDALYAQGRTTPGPIVTKAKSGQSAHECTMPDGTPGARAFDFAIECGENTLDWDEHDDEWMTVLAIGNAMGLVSGGSWGDWDHFELPNWRTA